ncbi:hypothetical protein LY76DRAFT_610078 [Colletotrichum caudatum]|nr:hypothetical protein LY76DRAFT_610078 [Colletotrichum caudatum]
MYTMFRKNINTITTRIACESGSTREESGVATFVLAIKRRQGHAGEALHDHEDNLELNGKAILTHGNPYIRNVKPVIKYMIRHNVEHLKEMARSCSNGDMAVAVVVAVAELHVAFGVMDVSAWKGARPGAMLILLLLAINASSEESLS